MVAKYWLKLAATLAALLALAPLLALVFSLLGQAQPSEVVWFSLLRLGGGTLWLALGTASLALLIGISTAWLIAACEFPLRKLLAFAVFIPFAIPPYLAAFVWGNLFDRLALPFSIRNLPGAWLVMASVLYPYVFLLVHSAFVSGSGALLAAARSLGCSAWGAFFRVALQLARPAIAIALMLVMMEVINDIAVSENYGIATLGYQVYDLWLNRSDKPAAIVTSCLLVVFVLLLSWIEARNRRTQRHFHEVAKNFSANSKHKLSGWRALAAIGYCSSLFIICFVVPVSVLAYNALLTEQVDWQSLLKATWGSTILAIGSVVVAYLLVAAITGAARQYPNKIYSLLEKLSRVGYAMPGTVFALGALLAAGAINQLLQNLFGISIIWFWATTPLLLWLALASRYLLIASGAVEAGLATLPPRLTSIARSVGASNWRVLLKVQLPLISPLLIAGSLLISIDVIKELPLTLVLRPFGFSSLATEAYSYASDENLVEAAPFALAQIALVAIIIIAVHRWQQSQLTR